VTTRQLLPVALILAATLTAWMAATPAPPARTGPDAAAQEAWEAPNIQAREPAKWIALIKQRQLWGPEGESADAAASAAAKQGWSIVGVAIQGRSATALISVGDNPSKPYQAGDSTPDGAKILKIEEDRLHVLSNGKESILEIYRQ
jgi:hypothetical protein